MRPDQARGSGAQPPGRWPRRFVSGPADRDALLVLAHLDGITPRQFHALAWREGSARGCLAAVRKGRAGSSGDRDRARVSVGAVRAVLDRLGARQVCPGDQTYPAQLLDLPDPPACLFVLGEAPNPPSLAVAIVGARRSSTYGREVAEGLGRGLAAAGVTVVSGAALGIDAAAHRGALSSGGWAWMDQGDGPPTMPGRFPTLAVLGSGIDVFHPPSNRPLIQRVGEVGAVLSEYPPGVPAMPWRFPARNRLVAGLSRAVVVVEGAPGSGSMITAEFALELGREVFAVPGPVTSPLAAVPNQLIREGASLARGPEDVLEALGVDPPVAPAVSGGSGSAVEPGLDPAQSLPPAERRVLEAVTGESVTVDAVAAGAGLMVGEALSALVALELRGLVREVAGRYERTAAGARHR